jgi:hydroxymethylglutaryl-CoA lyase
MDGLPAPDTIKLIECPRDAMQGWPEFIPTARKIEYLNSLLRVGFHTLDCGSFVSAKAVPQMSDTKEVLLSLSLNNTITKLLVIVANVRGAEEAVAYDRVTYLGFPFSVSPTFQTRNTNSTIEESLQRVEQIQKLCFKHNKELVIYLSMAFGNPYGDEYNDEILLKWASEIVKLDVRIISLADTVGLASPEQIASAFSVLVPRYTNVEFGVHLHSTINNWREKISAAFNTGCKRFDGALKGIGGCPMANDKLVGNINTEWLISYFKKQQFLQSLNKQALKKSIEIADEIFATLKMDRI